MESHVRPGILPEVSQVQDPETQGEAGPSVFPQPLLQELINLPHLNVFGDRI